MADASCLVPEPRGNLRSHLCKSAMFLIRISVSGSVWSTTEAISGELFHFQLLFFILQVRSCQRSLWALSFFHGADNLFYGCFPLRKASSCRHPTYPQEE
ncbi:hypothetical protein DLP14_14580 [Salmonella enterica]|nr:hypothetical protein [Salmonella enterica]EMD7797627.1 hypothetical protein [Salmonella enterica]